MLILFSMHVSHLLVYYCMSEFIFWKRYMLSSRCVFLCPEPVFLIKGINFSVSLNFLDILQLGNLQNHFQSSLLPNVRQYLARLYVVLPNLLSWIWIILLRISILPQEGSARIFLKILSEKKVSYIFLPMMLSYCFKIWVGFRGKHVQDWSYF